MPPPNVAASLKQLLSMARPLVVLGENAAEVRAQRAIRRDLGALVKAWRQRTTPSNGTTMVRDVGCLPAYFEGSPTILPAADLDRAEYAGAEDAFKPEPPGQGSGK